MFDYNEKRQLFDVYSCLISKEDAELHIARCRNGCIWTLLKVSIPNNGKV